jgi:hypothetical protein
MVNSFEKKWGQKPPLTTKSGLKKTKPWGGCQPLAG